MKTKTELRQYYCELRDQIPKKERKDASHVVCSLLKEHLAELEIKSVGIYYPIKGEIDILPLIEWGIAHGIQIFAPVMNPNCNMHYYQVESLESFSETGAYNIMEPSTTGHKPTKPECLIIPGVAFDRFGTRLGYGKGCFDRYLHDYDGQRVGVTYLSCYTDEPLPKEDFDETVDMIITDK